MNVVTDYRKGALVAAIAATLGAGAAAPTSSLAHPQGAIVVTTCADSGPGSLRDAVQGDVSGIPIDLTQLSCSTITLTSGAIIALRSLTLTGPGSENLAIDGGHGGAVLVEGAAHATLSIAGMTIRNGYVVDGYGGCIYSAGSVALDDVVVSDCKVAAHGLSPAQHFSGGGIAAKDDVIATNSRILNNLLYVSTANAYGGGISAGINITLVDTTVSGNYLNMIEGFGGGHALTVLGGGFWSPGVARLTRSTISGNTLRAAGLSFGPVAASGRAVIRICSTRPCPTIAHWAPTLTLEAASREACSPTIRRSRGTRATASLVASPVTALVAFTVAFTSLAAPYQATPRNASLVSTETA